MEGERIKLVVMGLSYNQLRGGAYALILAQVNGPYRIPVIIGSSEAQAIAVALEKIDTPMPLTHDLMTLLVELSGMRLKDVFIYNFNDGIFYSNLNFTNPSQGRDITLCGRTSDAIAIALRLNAPIYTTREILESTGFILEKQGPGLGKASGQNADGLKVEIEWAETDSNIEDKITGTVDDEMEMTDLEEKMTRAVEEEDYETAAELKRMIDDRRNKKL